MNGRKLDSITKRLAQVRGWLEESDYRRATELQRLLEVDLPDLIRTVREYNMRGQQGKCRYCGQQLRLIPGQWAGLYATSRSESWVICEDPNCPSAESPDGKHARSPRENGE